MLHKSCKVTIFGLMFDHFALIGMTEAKQQAVVLETAGMKKGSEKP